MAWFYRVAGRVPSLIIARRNISRAKARSALAAAAILIGVVAIGAIGAGGAAFKEGQLQTIQDAGATNVYVLPGIDMQPGSFDREDVRAIDETVGEAGVVATKGGSVDWERRGGRSTSLSVTYMSDPSTLYRVQAGAVPDEWRRSLVLSASFADEHGVGVGDRLTVVRPERTPRGPVQSERTYSVVGVLAPTQGFGSSDLYLPMAEAPERTYSQVRVTTGSVEGAEGAAERLRERFNDRKDRLLVFELTSLVRLFRTIVNGINLFLAGLGAISLLVAGVSIANTMLMAVIKRREEIGVLRAVGYRKVDIVRMLLVEAGLLGAAGSIVGLVIAVGVALAANAVFLGDPLAFTTDAVLYLVGAVVFGVLTSLIAGAYPAWRAANQHPVDALRG